MAAYSKLRYYFKNNKLARIKKSVSLQSFRLCIQRIRVQANAINMNDYFNSGNENDELKTIEK